MSKKPLQPSLADENAAKGGVAAVDRALSLLSAFTVESPALTLGELAEHAQLYKSTVLRLVASLEHAGLMQRCADNRYQLGPVVPRLNRVYTASFSLQEVVMPHLQALVDATRESAAFYIQQGDKRVCLFRISSPRPVRDYLQVGDVLPLDRGAGGRILLAFSNSPGAPYAKIREDGYVVMVGDRVPELAGIGAPVFDNADKLLGALTLTMPVDRLDRQHVPHVVDTARAVTAALGGNPDR